MGSKKKPSLPESPAIPAYQSDPKLTQRIDDAYGLGGRVSSFDFTGNLAGLQDTVSYSPQMTTLFLQGLRAELDPIYSDMRRDTINRLAASNQLESSVLPSALSDIEQNQQNQYIQQSTQFGINDINRAMQNKLALFGTGLGLQQYATSAGIDQQNAANQFNLQNYQNAASKWDMDSARIMNEYEATGGLGGAFSGGIGGALMGIGLAPFTGGASLALTAGLAGAGAAGGYFGSPGTGNTILQAGSLMGGATNPFASTSAGSSAAGLGSTSSLTDLTMKGGFYNPYM